MIEEHTPRKSNRMKKQESRKKKGAMAHVHGRGFIARVYPALVEKWKRGEK